MKEEFDSSSLSFSGLTLDVVIKVTPGPLYLSVHSNSEIDAIYNIVTVFADSANDIPHGRLLLGGDG
jgi:hypothetical protein